MFRDFYYLNRQTEFADGPLFELGGVSIQRRRDITFPSAILPSHLKDWNRTWFYCKNTAPADENPLPGYRPHRLNPSEVLPSKLTASERAQHAHIFPKIKALIANGLTGVQTCALSDLTQRRLMRILCQVIALIGSTPVKCFLAS